MDCYEWEIRKRDGSTHIACVSMADRDVAEAHSWHVNELRRGQIYVMTRIAGRTTYLHRVLMGLSYGDGIQVDHINRNGLDNRRENLRLASDGLNKQNFSPEGYANNTSGYRGVGWNKERQRWIARCTINGKTKRVGRFSDVHEAGRAVAEYRRQHMPYATG